jgi:hypothetical protein
LPCSAVRLRVVRVRAEDICLDCACGGRSTVGEDVGVFGGLGDGAVAENLSGGLEIKMGFEQQGRRSMAKIMQATNWHTRGNAEFAPVAVVALLVHRVARRRGSR